MKKQLVILLLPLVLAGCQTPWGTGWSEQEKSRVHKATVVAHKAVDLIDTTDPEVTRKFLKANARAWNSFNEAINGKEKADQVRELFPMAEIDEVVGGN